MRAARALIALSTLAAAACADDATGPTSWDHRIVVVERGGISDTVLAMAATPLVIEVHDRHGRPAHGVRVRFMPVPATPADSNSPMRGMYVCPIRLRVCARFSAYGSYNVTYGTEDTTDTAGKVRATVQFGVIAGTASIEVSVPEWGSKVTVPYLTRPGSLARVTAVHDTAIYVGASYRLSAHAADWLGNARTEAVTLSGITPTVIGVSSGRVTAVGVGRGRVVMRAGGIADTAYVSVPPRGRLAAIGWAPDLSTVQVLTLLDTDGSARRMIDSKAGNNGNAIPEWTPDGVRLVVAGTGGGAQPEQLQEIDTLGNRRSILADPDDFSLAIQPAFSANGAALYFYGMRSSTGVAGIYRANADGSGSQFLFTGVQPAPSPDGSRVAYVSGTSLMVRDMATGQALPIARDPELPRWSPAGDLIAYVSYDGRADVHAVQPDGNGLRTIASGFHDPGLSWSPDGKWLVAAQYGGGLELIRVADGERLPIPGTRDLTHPAWRP